MSVVATSAFEYLYSEISRCLFEEQDPDSSFDSAVVRCAATIGHSFCARVFRSNLLRCAVSSPGQSRQHRVRSREETRDTVLEVAGPTQVRPRGGEVHLQRLLDLHIRHPGTARTAGIVNDDDMHMCAVATASRGL